MTTLEQWRKMPFADECDEVAANIKCEPPKTFAEACRIVQALMPDETDAIMCNVAEALLARSARR